MSEQIEVLSICLRCISSAFSHFFVFDDRLEYALISKRPLMEIMKHIKRAHFLVIQKNYNKLYLDF